MRNNCNPCKPEYRPGDECSIYSSKIIYDGQSFPEADIRNGDSMNSVIESLVRKLVAVSGATASIQRDSFKGVQAVRLRYEPLNVLSVTYCGTIVPNDGYVVSGRSIKFKKRYCMGDEFADVNIVYTTLNSNILNTSCYG